MTKNDDSLYYKSDTIVFCQNYNYFLNNGSKQIILWAISKRYLTIQDILLTEPTRTSVSDKVFNIQLKKSDYGHLFEVILNKKAFDTYKIIDYRTDIMKIMRFDDLSEEKLFKQVNFLIYNVLKYDSLKVDSLYQDILRISAKATVKIKVRDGYMPNPEPLIVLNGHVLIEKEILKQFRLVETTGITYLTKEQSISIYGMRAINGVIILEVSKEKFREKWKNYPGNTDG